MILEEKEILEDIILKMDEFVKIRRDTIRFTDQQEYDEVVRSFIEIMPYGENLKERIKNYYKTKIDSYENGTR